MEPIQYQTYHDPLYRIYWQHTYVYIYTHTFTYMRIHEYIYTHIHIDMYCRQNYHATNYIHIVPARYTHALVMSRGWDIAQNII